VTTLLRAAPSDLRLLAGQSALLEASPPLLGKGLRVVHGIVRVFLPGMEGDEITLGFLQEGDVMDLDLFLRDWVGLEALRTTTLSSVESRTFSRGSGGGMSDGITSWMMDLLLIRHLSQSEQRLQALLVLLVQRLGRRNGSWYELPVRLSHERIGELIGSTRVTVTRMVSRLRQADLVVSTTGDTIWLRLAPSLVENSPRLI
jgi:CRP-like cAMP-binding protein